MRTEATEPPAGFAACRVFKDRVQTSHLVVRTVSGTPGPTLCGLTRFDEYDRSTGAMVSKSDLPGWSINGGVSGPDVEQVDCPECWTAAVGVETVWSCSHCGPHPGSAAVWCDAGCGRDYQSMTQAVL